MCWSKEFKDTLASLGILIIRVFAGFCIAAHGYQKFFDMGISKFADGLGQMGFPMPMVMAYLSAGTELICGVLIAVGLLTRLAAVPLVINMLVAAFVVHGKAYFLQNKGMEYALTLAAIYAGIALIGAGRFSLDHCLCRKKSASSQSAGGAK